MFLFSRGDRIRTCDPLVPNQVRYQLRYAPKKSYWLFFMNYSTNIEQPKRVTNNEPAEREGFEPSVQLPVRQFSKLVV